MDRDLLYTIVKSTRVDFFKENWEKDLQMGLIQVLRENIFIADELGGELKRVMDDFFQLNRALNQLSEKRDREFKWTIIDPGELSFSEKAELYKSGTLIVAQEKPSLSLTKITPGLVVFKRVSSGEKKELNRLGYVEVSPSSLGRRVFLQGHCIKGNLLPERGGIKDPRLDRDSLNYITARIWGYSFLREEQLQIMGKILKGENLLAILPTGAGKSLCFQLPALLYPGTSLVCAPLKSLIRDQIQNLNKKREVGWADFLDSSQGTKERQRVLQRWDRGELKLLYLAPERLQQERFREKIFSRPCSRQGFLIVDEAHCISEWGHDFRPAYLKMIEGPLQEKSSSVIGFSATAPPRVQRELKKEMFLKKEQIWENDTIDRPEIGLQVELITGEGSRIETLIGVLENHLPQFFNCASEEILEKTRGVIFVPYARAEGSNTRGGSGQILQEKLSNRGYPSLLYHGKMKEAAKKENQELFLQNSCSLLVATRAFGMGIDKPDISFIIHYYAPGSLEAYFQEIGRAGRDGRRSIAILIYRVRKKGCEEREKAKGFLDTRCAGMYRCGFGYSELCDYGVQSNFLRQQYPPREFHLESMLKLLKELDNYSAPAKLIQVQEGQLIFWQKYLLFLRERELIQDFWIKHYEQKGVTIHIQNEVENLVGDPQELILSFIKEDQQKKMKKIMALQEMEKYALEKKNCRRSLLLRFLGQRVENGVPCGFCDQENLERERARSLKTGPGNKELEQELVKKLDDLGLMTTHFWDLLEGVLEDGEKIETLKKMAHSRLQKDPCHPGWLLLAGWLRWQEEGQLEELSFCLRVLCGRGEDQIIREILTRILMRDEQAGFTLLQELDNPAGFSSLGGFFSQTGLLKKFKLLFYCNQAGKLLEIMGGKKRG